MNQFHQQPVPGNPRKVINKRGAWCPHCGNRNSYRSSSGVGCLTLGILFISMIGILFIPFLPKSWHCRECGHIWK
ncbi:MAG: transposase [Verrucomicrobiota bacterium]